MEAFAIASGEDRRMLHAIVLALATAAPAATVSGIPLDAPWKVTVYDLARTKFHHPAWGWQHSERNYQIAMQIAKSERMRVDTDVLFAAAMLHDMAAFMPCAQSPKLEHGDCAALQSPDILKSAGFPVEKIPAVQAAERGHMYYSNPGTQPEAILLHDADSLDFLGDMGAARMISLTGESAESFDGAIKSLRKFVHDIPPRLITATARKMGAQRAAELQQFLEALAAERYGT